ncbi:ribonuclease H-like domain-containing protein [Tanacetum coccineum]
MVTRFRVRINRPTKRLNLHVSSVSLLPKSYRDAFNDPNWQNAMRDEYIMLVKNKTWTLVPRPPDTNIVCCMWIFRHKYLADGTVSRYKAHLVANGSTQLEGVDVDETFSPVVKPGSIRTVLSLVASRHWPIHQLDVKNAFLHGDLSKTVYMHQSHGFRDSVHPDYKYAIEILDRAHMDNCNPSRTPIDTMSKLGSDGDPVSDPTLYGSLADLVAYSDADWAGCPTTRRSTSELEYFGVANVVAETCWLCNLLRELHTSLSFATLVYCDNVRVLHVLYRYQFADIFTKGLPPALFEEFRFSLSVRSPPALTAGEC